jgi:thioesterase domain-containing protein
MAVASHAMRPLRCEAVLLKANLRAIDHPDMHDGWKALILGSLEIRAIDAGHLQVMNEPFVDELAAALTECLKQAHSRNHPQS